MNKKVPMAILRAREQDSMRNTQNGALPTKSSRLKKSTNKVTPSCETTECTKTTTNLKTRTLEHSCHTNQASKCGKGPSKKCVLKQLSSNQNHQICKTDSLITQNKQEYDEFELYTTPIETTSYKEPRIWKSPYEKALKSEQQLQSCEKVQDTTTILTNIEESKEQNKHEITQVQTQEFEHVQNYKKIENMITTPTNFEEKENQQVGSMQLHLYGAKNNTNDGPKVEGTIVATSSLEEYYLSGGNIMAPTIQDFIGPVKIKKVGENRGRGLVLTSDVAAGDLLIISNHVAKVNKVKTELLEGNISLEEGCWTASHHVLAEKLVAILSAQAWRSARNRMMLFTLCCRGGEELPVPPMSLFQQDLPPTKISPTTPFTEKEITRLCGVVQCNAFGYTHISKQSTNIVRSWSCGLWTLPSFMNHSCIPNVATILIGDTMISIASRNLKYGDELTVAYFDIFRPLLERRSNMLHSWNFVCRCPRCILEETLQDSLVHITHAYGLREAQAAISVQILRTKLNNGKDWSRYPIIDLAQLVEYIEEILHRKKLTRDKKNWIRASYLSAYLADGHRVMVDVHGSEEPRRCKYVRKTHIQTALVAAKTVMPGHPQTLQIAAIVLKRAIQAYGQQSFLVKKARKRALEICLRLFGQQREEVLERIVYAAADEVLMSCVVFVGQHNNAR